MARNNERLVVGCELHHLAGGYAEHITNGSEQYLAVSHSRQQQQLFCRVFGLLQRSKLERQHRHRARGHK